MNMSSFIGSSTTSKSRWAIASKDERKDFVFAQAHLLPLVLHYGVLAAVLLILAGQLGIPTGAPAEVVLLLVGGYAVRSPAALVESLVLVAAADVLGSVGLVLLTRRGSGFARRVAGPRDGGRPATPAWLGRVRPPLAIFLLRSLPLLRIYGAVGSGLLRVPMRDYLAGTIPAGLLWTGTPLTLGYLLRGQVAAIAAGYPTGILSLAAVVPGLLTTIIVLRHLRRPAPVRVPSSARVQATAIVARSDAACRVPSHLCRPPLPDPGAWVRPVP
jgi:membrane protein DedA with SNARE-associated domain